MLIVRGNIMLAKRLRLARKEKKMTQEELAKIVSTKKTTISNYETGYSTPSNEMLSDLADALGVTSDYLLGRVDSPQGFKVDYSKAIKPDTNELIKYNQKDIKEYDPLHEINKLVEKYGIEQMGFFDIEKWKKLGPEDIKMLEKQFKLIVDMAEERNKEDK
jgi:HTH-type transcriptional regulator, competence development regulator